MTPNSTTQRLWRLGVLLLTQRGACGFVGQLPNAAAIDLDFPRSGDVDVARK